MAMFAPPENWGPLTLATIAELQLSQDFFRERLRLIGRDFLVIDAADADDALLDQLGHVARANPEYRQRAFEDIETDLQRGWTEDLRTRYGDWAYARPFAREAYERQR